MFVIMAAFGAMFLTDYQRHGTLLLVLILLYVLAFAIGMGQICWLFQRGYFPDPPAWVSVEHVSHR